jgi:nucleoside-diphosphate-sugar epimerase
MTGLVLLTGSEGAVGVWVRRELEMQGYRVRGLDLRTARRSADEHVVADLRDPVALRAAFLDVDAVVHAAAIPGDHVDGPTVMATNVLGTWNVLQSCAEMGIRRVVCLSSINAQGSVGGHRTTDYLPIDDDYPHHPLTPYQLSKHLLEEMCRAFSERYGMVTLCLRPVWVARPDKDATPGFGTDAFVGEWRDDYWAYVDVRDVADAVVRSLRVVGVRHDCFLLAARDTSVARETRELVSHEYPDVPWPKVDPGDYFADAPHRSLIDCHHAREVLDWEPRHSWRDTRDLARPGR